jgi:enamine deaminase RidA (YjgF/YER057c/UK114 family)
MVRQTHGYHIVQLLPSCRQTVDELSSVRQSGTLHPIEAVARHKAGHTRPLTSRKEPTVERRAIDPWTWQDEFDFSQAIEVSGTQRVVYCAGQTSVDADGRPLHPDDMEAQFHCALDNLEQVLAEAGLTLGDVVRLNYFVTDVPAFLKAVPNVGVRLKAAGCKPASMLIGVAWLAWPELLVELEATAVA